MIIAIDGPAASGKGTLSKQLAAHYTLNHLDTGLLYRALGQHMMVQGLSEHDEDRLAEIARTLEIKRFDTEALMQPGIAVAASKVAALTKVRLALLTQQRTFAAQSGGAILDGRDIGTVILPDANAKLFVTASLEARARRRFTQFQAKGLTDTLEDILTDLQHRDARDAARQDAPMKKAEDAYLLDTTNLSIKATVEAACAYIDRVTGSGKS